MLYIDSLCFSLETLCRKIIQDSKQKPENYSGNSKKNTSVQVQVKMNQKCFLENFSKNSHQAIKKSANFFHGWSLRQYLYKITKNDINYDYILRILCLFDRNMREMAEVRNLDVAKCQKEDSDIMDAVVIFEDPTLMNDVFFKISDINCTYTVEVAPPLNSVSET